MVRRPSGRTATAACAIALGLVVSAASTAGVEQDIAPTARFLTSPLASWIIAEVSESDLRATVRDLVALGPRMGGTTSGSAAASRAAAGFRSLGLDTRVFDDPPVATFEASAWDVRIGPGGTRLASAWPYTFSPSVAPPRSAPLVIVDDATPARPEAWRDRVVYTERLDIATYRRFAASRHPPVAILTSAPHEAGRYTDWAAIDTLPRGTVSSVPVFGIGSNDGSRVGDAARAGRAATISLASNVGRGSPQTVMATLPGEREQYYLVSAHGDSDSGGPGADDNASGVAVVLELARLLARVPAQLPRAPAPFAPEARSRSGASTGPRATSSEPLSSADGRRATSDGPQATSHERRLPFSIRFVIWGEEYASARAYIGREGDRLGLCLGVINIDQAGTGAEREAIYAEGNNVPWNRDLLEAFDHVGRERLGHPGFWPEFATTPTQGGTDAFAFLPRAFMGMGLTSLQVPAVTVYTAAWDRTRVLPQTPGWRTNAPAPGQVIVDYSRYYHSSGDSPANTTEREPQNMVRAVKLIGLTLARLAGQD